MYIYTIYILSLLIAPCLCRLLTCYFWIFAHCNTDAAVAHDELCIEIIDGLDG